MRRTTLAMAFVLAALGGLIAAAPASAATTGTLCGQVMAFTAPTAIADGSITVDGTTEVIDSSAFGAIEASTLTVLNAVATADATTCVEITADVDGNIVDLAVAAQAEICGTATLDTTTGLYSVGGVELPTAVLTGDADLMAALDLAVRAGADVCAAVTIDTTSGLIATVGVDATVTLCGSVTLDAEGNATIDGVVVDADLLDANAAALLALAVSANGTACVAVDAVSSGGTTTVAVNVTIEVCAEVTAVTDSTITLGDVTFAFAGAADAGIEIGDEVCVAAGTAPGEGPTITEVTTATGATPGADGGGVPLPDTALDAPVNGMAIGTLLLVAAGIGASAIRRAGIGLR